MKVRRIFHWHAVHKDGSYSSGEIAAIDREHAQQQLIAQGVYPIKLRAQQRLNKRGWKADARLTILKQLKILLNSGLPLANSLLLLAQQHTQANWRYLLHDLHQQVQQGKSFSSALKAHPWVFSTIECHLFASGEMTASLDRCCAQLIQQETQRQHLRQQIRTAIRYPLIVLCMAIVMLSLMVFFILPEFATLYSHFDAQLPPLTQALISFSHYAKQYAPFGLLASISLSMGYRYILHPLPRWQQREDRLILHLPLLKNMLKTYFLATIFRTFMMTHKGGIDVLSSLDNLQHCVNNHCYKNALQYIHQQISEGISLSTAFQQPLFPSLVYQLIKTAEDSGTLDEILTELAHLYEQQTVEWANSFAQILEPICIIFVGSLVGLFIIAMYLPIFQLGDILQ